jgi:taurine dioxygenase
VRTVGAAPQNLKKILRKFAPNGHARNNRVIRRGWSVELCGGGEKMGRQRKSAVEIMPTGEALGADVLNVRFDALSTADIAVINAAWEKHLVLRFGGSAIDEQTFLAFTQRFGTPMLAPAYPVTTIKNEPKKTPITTVSNLRDEQGRPLGALGADALGWHSDMAYDAEPPVRTALHALEVPETGGNTTFLNMYLLYEALSPSLQRLVETLSVCHPPVEHARFGPEPVPTVHPLVQTHSGTGRKALFLGRRPQAALEGLPRDESEEILDRLWRMTTYPDFIWTQSWRSGDVVMWDNRYVMHRRDAFDPDARRILRRVTLAGSPDDNDLAAA